MIIVYDKKERRFTGYKDYGVVMGIVKRPKEVVLGSVVEVFEDADFIFGGVEVVKSARGGSRGHSTFKQK